ncbi:MAG: plasmid pRiA4b ORF-3 family protein [Sphaerochaeta sp.]|nr:plasmid pRiA4b ORF-3 family protein [Sphaerochaeta sp.]
MYIQCTKKLLAKLEDVDQEILIPPQPLFCWHANVFDLYGSEYAVALHDVSDYVVFFKVRSFYDFAMQLVEEIETALMNAGLPEEVVVGYMIQGGPPVFGPTSGPSAVGRLNNAVRMLKEQVAKSEDTAYLVEQQNSAGATTPMVHLDVKLLLLGKGKVTRSFVVPLHIHFLTLHTILQIGFGWTDDHLHKFTYNKERGRIDEDLRERAFSHMGRQQRKALYEEEGSLLSDYIPAVKRLEYEYDFGDSWMHIITAGKIELIEGEPYAKCTGGQGITPPEDCGGPYGYAELCAILKDPTHERYENMQDWVGDISSGGFDQVSINIQLERLKPFAELG